MGSVVLGLAIAGAGTSPQTTPHAQYSNSMLQGVPEIERQLEMRLFGLVFGLLQIAFFASCLLLGVRSSRGPKWLLAAIGSVYVAVFALMVVANDLYVVWEFKSLYFGFPAPTALMLYGVGGVPLLFALLYLFAFDHMIFSPQDSGALDDIIREHRARSQGAE